jgi:hypothetical protein
LVCEGEHHKTVFTADATSVFFFYSFVPLSRPRVCLRLRASPSRNAGADNFRYLTCCNCDRGPLGITFDADNNSKFYVTHARVSYGAAAGAGATPAPLLASNFADMSAVLAALGGGGTPAGAHPFAAASASSDTSSPDSGSSTAPGAREKEGSKE